MPPGPAIEAVAILAEHESSGEDVPADMLPIDIVPSYRHFVGVPQALSLIEGRTFRRGE